MNYLHIQTSSIQHLLSQCINPSQTITIFTRKFHHTSSFPSFPTSFNELTHIRTEKILHQDWKVRSIPLHSVPRNFQHESCRGTPYTTFHLARKLAEFRKDSEVLSGRFLHPPSFFSSHFRPVKRWAYTRTEVNLRWITRDPVPFPVAPSVTRERSHRPLCLLFNQVTCFPLYVPLKE